MWFLSALWLLTEVSIVVSLRQGSADTSEHPNDKSERGTVFMVFPYMDHDLCGLLANRNFTPTQAICKTLMQQLLDGLAYIHGVCHPASPARRVHADVLSKTSSIAISRRPISSSTVLGKS